MPKRKRPVRSAAEQAKRFKEAAKSVGADETGATFEAAFAKIVRASQPKKRQPKS
jgi:hypothetical protein